MADLDDAPEPDDLDVDLDGDLDGDLDDEEFEALADEFDSDPDPADFDFDEVREADGDYDEDELAGLDLPELDDDQADESLDDLGDDEADDGDDAGDSDDSAVAADGGATALVEEGADLLDDLADGRAAAPSRELDVDDEVREGEFVCRSCFMAKRESALADEERMLCRDCV